MMGLDTLFAQGGGTGISMQAALMIVLWMVILVTVLVIGIIVADMLRYGIRVLVYKVVGNQLMFRQDFARQFVSKKDGLSRLILKSNKLDISTIVDKSTMFFPGRRNLIWGYGETLMLRQDGPNDAIDSFSSIDPKKFYEGIVTKDSEFSNMTKGTTKADYALFIEKTKKEHDKNSIWDHPLTIPIVTLSGAVIVIVLLFVFGGQMLNEQYAQANTYSQLMLDGLEKMGALADKLGIVAKSMEASGVTPPP